MSEFQTLARVGDIPAGEGRCFPVAGKLVAVFLIDGAYHAINDTCPHMGASLAEGFVEAGAVFCPWHAWRFCIKDGTWLDNPKASVKTDSYEVRVIEDEIQIRLPERDASPRKMSFPPDDATLGDAPCPSHEADA